ncbi:MAG: hypothetical protein ACFBSC_21960 [Microcoleaceae cyanobacterium]
MVSFSWEETGLEWTAKVRRPESEQFQIYQFTQEFYQEVERREAWEQHCQWYAETAQRHQQELKKMRSDINFFGYFLRRRRDSRRN